MTRKLLAALLAAAGVACLLVVRADDPTAKPPDVKKPDAPAVDPAREDSAAKEKLLREQFETFKTEWLNLREILSTSDKDEDKATVQVLDKVIEDLKDILSPQERHTTQIERGQKGGKDLAKDEQKIHDNLKGINDPNGKDKPPDFKKAEAKYDSKPGSDAKGEAKNDTEGPKGDA